MITSDNFYERETESVEGQRLRERAKSLLGVSLGTRVWRKEENGENWVARGLMSCAAKQVCLG
jgi:hypothetical protein